MSEGLKSIVVFCGQGKFLYSFFFIYFLLSYSSVQDTYTIIMFFLWFGILILNTSKKDISISHHNSDLKEQEIGELLSIQYNKLFTVRIFDNSSSFQKFDLVKFNYAKNQNRDSITIGMITDIYFLNDARWAKIVEIKTVPQNGAVLKDNLVYKIVDAQEKKDIDTNDIISRFVGTVCENSTIGKIHFEYSEKESSIQEGDLLEIISGKNRVFYQVINGITQKSDLLEKNKYGYIQGEAIQIGEWKEEFLSFEKFGWVPEINSLVLKADTSDIKVPQINLPSYQIGTFPGTNLPALINLDEAIGTHLGIIGISGSGKTFVAIEIIHQILPATKVYCIDITGEWKKNIAPEDTYQIIPPEKIPDIEGFIANKEASPKGRNSAEVLAIKTQIFTRLNELIEAFENQEKGFGLFELPNLSNTSFVLEFTQLFLEGIFLYAKNNPGKKHCIVLEEAHTIVPETTFLGDLGDYSSNKGLVAKIGQIALQGRKYGVGLLVITQRTANVSKTVLTQCNTIICFQAFDDTSFNFLGNYIGKDLVQSLPNLKKFHAIIAGKAVNSNIPIIADLTKRD